MKYPGFFGDSNRQASYMADSEELINLYRVKNGGAPFFVPTPGFGALFSVPEGPSRGSCTANGLTYVVAGYRVYEWDGMTATARATLTAADANPATLCWNGPAGLELFITSGDVGYILNLTTFALTVVLASGASMGAYLDGFFLALDATTGALAISDLLDGLTWDPTQVALRSSAPDPWIAMTVTTTEIDLIGSRTREVWFNAGSFPYPFEQIQGSFREQGIAAPYSLPRDVAPVVWVSANAQGNRQVLLRQGYEGIPISSDACATQIQGYATVNDATSFSFQVSNHTFICLRFPSAMVAWLYDVTEPQWVKWLFWNTLTSTWEAVRVANHVLTPDGTHLVGDRASGAFYRMAADVFTDVDGELVLRERTPPRVAAPDNVRFITDEIQLLMDVGIGAIGTDDTDPDVNPMAMLQTSRDGGRTFGPERTAAIGKQGEYLTRVFWTQCGQARNRVDRFRFAFRGPTRIADALMRLRVGVS